MDRDPAASWDEKRDRYLAARDRLLGLRHAAAKLHSTIREEYGQLAALKARGQEIQRFRGAHFRAVVAWTPEECERRDAFQQELHEVERRKRAVKSRIDALKSLRLSGERGADARLARESIAEIVISSEMARLVIVRNALLTLEGLPHTNHRPSAWWLPMIDRSGSIFRRMAATTELYTEPLVSR